MCSIILHITPTAIYIAANRDEMVDRPWAPPAAHWPAQPGIIAGLDKTAGGTWLGINAHGVMAAILNRHGTLGPAAGKRSRGELPLLALRETTAAAAAAAIAKIDASTYRSFNLVTADAKTAFFLSGLESGHPEITKLPPGTTMITSGEPNELSLPRISRHLPKFQTTPIDTWQTLLADNTGPWESALNIPERENFATTSASLMTLSRNAAPTWLFAPGPPDKAVFAPIRS